MKKSHKRLLVFEVSLFVIIILLGFMTKILSSYTKILFILALTVLFKLFFGLEKNRNANVKNVIIEVLIFFFVVFILFYLGGLYTGFYKSPDFISFEVFFKFVLPIILTVICTEVFRYSVFKKSEGSTLVIITSVIFFILLDLAPNFSVHIFDSKRAAFNFFAFFLAPSLSNNIAASYIAYKAGYKPNIVWLLIINLYMYLLPIIPDYGNYITCIIECVSPILLLLSMKRYFYNEADEKIDRDYNKPILIASILPMCFLLLIIYLTCGKFTYTAMAVASGSMVPTFHRGDVVVVKKVEDYTKLKEGDVIAFNAGDVITVHRILIIDIEDGNYYFYTKGDANKSMDNFVLDGSAIIGTVEVIVPYVGYPTVWLSEV